ncbi:glycoside hydrolase family 32 protein [Propionispira raffinosivorans]|uniref:glycoside hydrolase family 32 protein n=1 Tax=Propionispira raffinosivorans TaxID=86959 RepID=UPI00037B573E|nr:sucrose-6-phosphate hydrolase [Propionispira raffinosivorans]
MVWTKTEYKEKIIAALPMKHFWHNRFHIEMPFGLINDPNGLSFYQGEYHIFYQWNPYSCEHKHKSWGYIKTTDFVHYTIPGLALVPGESFDKDGCYTGCGFVDEDKLQFVYTGNVKNDKNERESYQCLGSLQVDGTIKKEGVLIAKQPSGYTAHFRDPYIFYRAGEQYMVLGIQTEALKGRVVLYHKKAGCWEFFGEIKTSLGDFGYMWECPNMLRFADVDVLLFSPQGLPAKETKWQNLYQTGYIAGNLNLSTIEFKHGNFEEVDMGFDFYAPQVFEANGRHLMLGWIGMPDCSEDYPTSNKGWMFALTMMRELTMKNGRLYQQPIHEIEKLRGDKIEISRREFTKYQGELPRGSEILLDLVLGEAKQIKLEFYFALEKITFSYDRQKKLFCIDRNKMKLGGKGIRKFKLAAEANLRLHFFIDRTVIELFCQDGEKTATLMYFPEDDCSCQLVIQADDIITSVQGSIWHMGCIEYK